MAQADHMTGGASLHHNAPATEVIHKLSAVSSPNPGCLIPLLVRWNFPLSEIPGPSLASWTRFWWLGVLRFGKADEKLVRLHKEYGPIVRIAPNTVIVSDPETARKILAVGSKCTRGPWFDSFRLEPNKTTVVSERDPKRHQELGYLSGKDIIDVEAIIDEHVIPFLTLDIISRLCLGNSFHCLEADNDQYGLLDALHSGMVAQQYLATLLEFKDLLFLSESRLRLRIANTTKQGSAKDMLDSFLSRGLRVDQATNELLVVLSSGVGATACAVQGIIRCIVADPHAQRKLQRDIDAVVSSYGYGPLDAVAESAICQMPYFQACITEGLRLYPPVSLLRERVVPPEGDIMHGYRIPGGTFPIFGSEPEEFRPERWLINDKFQLKQMARHLELVFGYGASKCLGVNLAYTELNKIIFELFRNHDLQFANPEHPWTARGDFVLSDFHVVVVARANSAKLIQGGFSMSHAP
ncbi:cytochrome P450 [Byssothecium circinans]|uniref:Cytochrome P450 n=1 Tax=Byssothecium circinans TaxID=147558 RepID=A0A6A5TGS9_9PLEO|nr:cytochrome P450 [Byssothecium circinans]